MKSVVFLSLIFFFSQGHAKGSCSLSGLGGVFLENGSLSSFYEVTYTDMSFNKVVDKWESCYSWAIEIATKFSPYDTLIINSFGVSQKTDALFLVRWTFNEDGWFGFYSGTISPFTSKYLEQPNEGLQIYLEDGRTASY